MLGDLAEIDSCDAVLAAFTAPDEGTSMEAWYAHANGKLVVAYTGGTRPHPWTVYVADAVHADLEDAVVGARQGASGEHGRRRRGGRDGRRCGSRCSPSAAGPCP